MAIVGPTGVGKTGVAVDFGLRRGGDIVSVDARQVYRGVGIAANAPTSAELMGVRCHLVDVLDPAVPVTAASYADMVRVVVAELESSGTFAVFTAGTGLYLKAALEGLDLGGAPSDPGRRTELERAAAENLPATFARLERLDPEGAARTDRYNPVRVVRRLELALDRSARGPGDPHREIPTVKVGLWAPREVLYEWIEARVDEMLGRGMAGEVGTLLEGGLKASSQALKGIGVREMVAHIRDGVPMSVTRDLIVRNTRRYAKRQLTWFRADPDVRWLDVTVSTRSAIVDRVCAIQDQP